MRSDDGAGNCGCFNDLALIGAGGALAPRRGFNRNVVVGNGRMVCFRGSRLNDVHSILGASKAILGGGSCCPFNRHRTGSSCIIATDGQFGFGNGRNRAIKTLELLSCKTHVCSRCVKG